MLHKTFPIRAHINSENSAFSEQTDYVPLVTEQGAGENRHIILKFGNAFTEFKQKQKSGRREKKNTCSRTKCLLRSRAYCDADCFTQKEVGSVCGLGMTQQSPRPRQRQGFLEAFLNLQGGRAPGLPRSNPPTSAPSCLLRHTCGQPGCFCLFVPCSPLSLLPPLLPLVRASV